MVSRSCEASTDFTITCGEPIPARALNASGLHQPTNRPLPGGPVGTGQGVPIQSSRMLVPFGDGIGVGQSPIPACLCSYLQSAGHLLVGVSTCPRQRQAA